MKWKNGVARVQTSHGVKWKIRYRAPLSPTTRRTKQKIETLVGCRSELEARQVLASRMTAVFNGTYRPRSNEKPVTVADFAERFLQAKADKPTHRKYTGMMKNHLLPYFGKMLVAEVRPSHCEAYRVLRLSEGAAPKTVKNELDCFGVMFSLAVDDELTHRDPTDSVDHGKIDNKRRRLMVPEEAKRLAAWLAECDTFVRPLFAALYYTSARLGEALTIRQEHVDFDRMTITYWQHKTKAWVHAPMHPALASELGRWLAALPVDSEWVFPGRIEAHPLSVHSVHKPWKAMLAAAGVENLWRHDLRRHFVTTLRAAGVDDDLLKTFTGHATPAMLDRYDANEGMPNKAKVEAARAALGSLPDLKAISENSETQRSETKLNVKKSSIIKSKRRDAK